MEVKPITYKQTKPFILEVHYTRRMPNIKFAFGLFNDDNKLIGVVTFGVPASYTLCKGIAGEENKNNILELNRLVILPEYNKQNYASMLISKSLKMLPPRMIIVSYADVGGWGHVGYVYQATNFYYTGMTRPRTDKFTNGKHNRHENKNENRRQIRTAKYRYVTITGTKKDKKELLKQLKYPIIKEYPKGESVHYNTSNPKPINEKLGKVI